MAKRLAGSVTGTKKKKKVPKKPVTPKVRAKSGAAKLSRKAKLALGARYVAAQKVSAIGPKVATQAKAVEDQSTVVVTKEGERASLALQLANKIAEVQTEEVKLGGTLDTFAHDGAIAANGDVDLLTSLAITPAAVAQPVDGPPATPDAPVAETGELSGTLAVGFTRPAGAASMLVQWRPDGGPEASRSAALGTSRASLLLEGLPAAGLVRVRVLAIGNGMSDWSEETLARAG